MEKRPTRSDTAGGFISATPAENGGGGKTKRKTMKEVENPNKVTHKIVASRGSKNLVADEKSGKTAKKGTSLAKKLEEEVVVVYEDDFEDYESDFEEDEDQEQFEDDFEEEEVIDDHDEDDGKKVSKNGRVNEALNLKLLDPQTRAQISQSTLMKRVASAAGNRSSQQMVVFNFNINLYGKNNNFKYYLNF